MLERSVHKESAKPESKNSKETSENNTDIEMDLHIMFSNVFECYSNVSSVHLLDKRLTGAGHSNRNLQKRNSWTKAEKMIPERRIYFTV